MRRHSQSLHKTPILTFLSKVDVGNTTRIDLGVNARAGIAGAIEQLGAGNKVLVLTQREIAADWLEDVVKPMETAGFAVETIELPAGEACKSQKELFRIWEQLQKRSFQRKDVVVGLGGGAVTDVAGFAASTYLRGLTLVLVPTTLLAQVDASIGGKTGINLDAGKNLAGTFYFPHLVTIDQEMLSSLPPRDFASGMGEIVKYALIEKSVANESEYAVGARSLFALLQRMGAELAFDHPAMGSIIAACVKMKLAVVSKDPYETRLRRILNLGHTFAHAIEKVSEYGVTHGEAVSMGAMFALQVSRRSGRVDGAIIEEVRGMLAHCTLPTELTKGLDRKKLVDAIAYDKKRTGESIKFVLPLKDIGTVDIDSQVSLEELRQCVEEF
jgi:3-dehydroquinate synthase